MMTFARVKQATVLRCRLFILAGALVACRATTPASLEGMSKPVLTPNKTPIEAPLPSVERYAKPHFGFYFLGPGDQSARAVPGEDNPFFDPNRPTLIYFHGWSVGELTKTQPRTFNKHTVYPEAPDLDLVKVWTDLGWNVGMMDWTQFADNSFEPQKAGFIPATFSYDSVERRIWARDERNELTYYLSDGSRHALAETNLAAMFSKQYYDFMNGVAKPGVEVRFFGHSLGTQMAVAVAHRVYDMGLAAVSLNRAILPTRLSLADITSSNCPKDWLPSTKVRQRGLSLGCLNNSGDWISERLGDAVDLMQKSSQQVAFDAYRCWAISSTGILADQEKPLLDKMVLTDLRPNTAATDLLTQHAYCIWTYLASIALPPPVVVENAKSASLTSPVASDCANISRGADQGPRGVSASSSNDWVRKLTASKVYFIQTKDSVGPANRAYRVTCQTK